MGTPQTVLTTGANAPIGQTAQLRVRIEWTSAPADLDISCFMVGENGKVPSDDYFIFYNQDSGPGGTVQYERKGTNTAVFTIRTAELGSEIAKFVFSATLDGPGTFEDVAGCRIVAEAASGEILYEIKEATRERSLVFAELYRHASGLKLRAVGRGFNGGLKPLAEAHGVEIEDERTPEETPTQGGASTPPSPPASTPGGSSAPAAPPVPAPKKPDPEPSVPLGKIDLLKRKVGISLEKKNIAHEKARVAVVFDASGSMTQLYKNGTVQRAFERILAVSARMDDDGIMDVWFFATKMMRAPSVTEFQYENYVKKTYPGPSMKSKLGFGNNEPVVMEDIVKKYTQEDPDYTTPTYIIFFSDGGIYETKKISKLLIKYSDKPIFWQFVGLGRANYGVLEQLDDLKGRTVDNADFFALDDLDTVSDEDLYDRLLNEFPSWLKEVRSRGILTG
ncbi:VWA domain-containing protein [Saccharibacillus sp. CPCC 101409]|uniref:VWA domain-containing protein n=1 Tax=Saccharibacillus sp. CPCC 101409 TaxID=3058041 RepID=UPI002674098D|nr:VWA domain-containing protein [Saccharibacillus sp. CPCC 101409]MDO3410269.1 VWA domain-containing protein [Saccharibacillus sp. CPCC 101409]